MRFHTICPAIEDTIRLIYVNINNKIENVRHFTRYDYPTQESLKLDRNYWTKII